MDRGEALSLVPGNSDGSYRRNILSESQPREHTWECAGSSPRRVTSGSPAPGREGARGWKRGRPAQTAVGHQDGHGKGFCVLKVMVSPALLPEGKMEKVMDHS